MWKEVNALISIGGFWRKCFVTCTGMSLFWLCTSGPCLAQPGKDKDPLSWDRNVARLFARHCYDCHADEDPSGDVNLKGDIDVGKIVAARAKWLRALAMLESKQMPPPDERQPSQEDRELMIQFLNETLNNIDCESQQDPGKPVLRRLNRTEYDNVVQDLTQLDLRLAENFPPDPVGYGFDNIGDALTMTPTQVEVYHTAAKKIVTALRDTQGNPWRQAIEEFSGREQAKALLQRFASLAFRRPVDDYYVNRLLRIYDQALAGGDSAPQAIGHGLTAILMSPNFLMRVEQDRVVQDAFYAVDDYELASRLSFFLWSRGPDAELLDLASQGTLAEEKVLRAQVVRMLKDQRSQALVDNFFAQWLGLREVATHTPDSDVFPEFDEQLRQSMMSELRLFLGEIVQQDRPLTSLIDANFSYLDHRLAKHYGLDVDTPDSGFVRFEFDNRLRGGILTSAAFLMIQSDPGRTNIPRRGNFIAGQLLGDAPPPPPPGVPPLDAQDDGEQRSLRETFELHRSAEECKGCHAKIDPLGFSLENYDAIGRYRTSERGVPIDASASLPDGQEFDGAPGLKDFLLSKQESILRILSTKLMIYAVGRGLQMSDECVIKSMLEAAQESDQKFSAIVTELVLSLPFTHRRNVNY